ncbi:hypothetical protein COU60_02415 [Candidatus Pacearchaeota archaeon CG10_big_fil_rev_8_21_14_0_10_34_76]|nr:MAG: hypothetical protein COU60_02415 [Candidatus Pacearchaeota archaeon CG10_big_fil_rev_8_21_14_0_10_34_76]
MPKTLILEETTEGFEVTNFKPFTHEVDGLEYVLVEKEKTGETINSRDLVFRETSVLRVPLGTDEHIPVRSHGERRGYDLAYLVEKIKTVSPSAFGSPNNKVVVTYFDRRDKNQK